MKRREFYAVPAHTLKPEYQLIAPRKLLCLLCARLVDTRGQSVHEKGIEHRTAKEEMAGKKAS